MCIAFDTRPNKKKQIAHEIKLLSFTMTNRLKKHEKILSVAGLICMNVFPVNLFFCAFIISVDQRRRTEHFCHTKKSGPRSRFTMAKDNLQKRAGKRIKEEEIRALKPEY